MNNDNHESIDNNSTKQSNDSSLSNSQKQQSEQSTYQNINNQSSSNAESNSTSNFEDTFGEDNEQMLFKHQLKSEVDNNSKTKDSKDDDNAISSYSDDAKKQLSDDEENGDFEKLKVGVANDKISSYNGVKTDEIDTDEIEKVEKEETKTDKHEVHEVEEIEDEEYLHKKKILKILRRIIYVVCIFLVSILLALIILFSATDYFGMFRPYNSKNVHFPNTYTISEISDKLESEGIIRSSFLFKTYAEISGKASLLQSGTYSLDSEMSYHEIIKVLKSTKNRSTVKVTIPEGYSVTKMAELLEKKGVCSSEDFLAAANTENPDFDFADDLPTDKNRLYKLEGYLFPDTYEFYMDDSADSVVKKMLTNFDNRIDDELRESIKKSGKSIDDIVNLASIIQAETGGSDQMCTVSSVFWNRLNNGYQGNKMLQSDVTVLYGKNVILPTLGDSEETQKMMDSYSTYTVTGLPEGPINNPGKAAIVAALDPDTTNYYFFVTDKKGNYYYARTYNQHKANCQKALENGAAEGTATTE